MATKRLPMRQIREILRLKWTLQRSHRETARSVGVSAGGVASVVSRATHQGLTWEAVTGLTDDQLEERLWGPKLPLSAARSLPDPVHLHTELLKVQPPAELAWLAPSRWKPSAGTRQAA